MNLIAEPSGENFDQNCDCCGNRTNSVWGYIYREKEILAAYFVHWTSDKPDHHPNFDFIFGTWGNDCIKDKKLSSWVYQPTGRGTGSFMAIDGRNRPTAKSDLCDVVLTREQVINDQQLMGQMTNLIDAIWLQDSRISEIVNFDKNI